MSVRAEVPLSSFTSPHVPLPFAVWTATKCGSGDPQPQTVTIVLLEVLEVVVTEVLDDEELDDEELDDDELELDDDEDEELLDDELLDVVGTELLVVELLDVLEEVVTELEVLVDVDVVEAIGGLQTDGSAVHPPAGQSFARYLLVSSFLFPVAQTRQ